MTELCWGMAIATYPFFGKVRALIGRLTAIQGDCTAAEIHRRVAETYGQRETAHRATNRVIQMQAHWGAIKRVDKGRRVIRQVPVTITNDALVAWLIEAAVRYTVHSMAVTTLQSASVLHPFLLDRSLSLVVSSSPSLELRVEGSRAQLVSIR